MKKRIKASLSLSVNAIVVFVLAFAMLGVGLMFIQKFLGGGMMDDIEGVVKLDDLKDPATSSNPLTISSDVDIRKKEDLKLNIGYYNTDNNEAENAKVGIIDCLDDEDGTRVDFDELPMVISDCDNIPGSEGMGYPIIIKAPEELDSGHSYVCKMVVFNGGTTCEDDADDTAEIYLKERFYLNVVS